MEDTTNTSLTENLYYESLCNRVVEEYINDTDIDDNFGNELKEVVNKHKHVLQDPKYKDDLLLTNKIANTKFKQAINDVLYKKIEDVIHKRFSNPTTQRRLIRNITFRAWVVMQKYAAIYLGYALWCLEKNDREFIDSLTLDTRLELGNKMNILTKILIIGIVVVFIIAIVVTYLRWKYIKPLVPSMKLKLGSPKVIKPVK